LKQRAARRSPSSNHLLAMVFEALPFVHATLGKAKGESRVFGRDEVILVSCARDRFHRGSVKQAVLYEALVDMNINHLAEHDESCGGIAIDVNEPHSLQPLAFEGARRSTHPRWLHHNRRCSFQARHFHLVHTAWMGPRCFFYLIA
jgi:hypothetical protein